MLTDNKNKCVCLEVMATSAPVNRLENDTECAICVSDIVDARVLPCVHTFCLKCIEKWSQKENTGEKVSCPICREVFEIPEGGITALPKNCFVEKLLDVKKLSTTLSRGDVVCDICCDAKEKSGERATKKATVYCIECRHNMCEQCCNCHQKLRFSGGHKLIELDSELNVDELLLKCPEVCDKHMDECTKIYCFDCKEAVCMMCYIESHHKHTCSDVKQVAEDLGKQMTSNATNLVTKVTECQTVLENIHQNERTFCQTVVDTKNLICERAEGMIRSIEGYKNSLLDQLSVTNDKQKKGTANVCEEIERHQVVVENFIRYSNEVKEKGTACDIAKLAGKLNARSEDLQKFNLDRDLSTDYNVTDVSFTSELTDDDLKKVFGNLSIDVHGMCEILSRFSLIICQMLKMQALHLVCVIFSLFSLD